MHGSAVFDGKMWVMGGGVYNEAYPNNTVVDYNDVWCSDDGRTWEQVRSSAEWGPRRFHCVFAHDEKIWVVAGATRSSVGENDVWFSTDRENWIEAEAETIWSIRHEPACLSFKGSIWLMGGLGAELYNDVWVATMGQTKLSDQ
jgi:hypothetical protein